MGVTRRVYLTGKTARILQALRAGPLEAYQVLERFPGVCGELTRLVRAGYIERVGDGRSGYRITEAGRAACPNRRDA